MSEVVTLQPSSVILAAHVAALIRGVKEVQHARGEVSNRRVAKMGDFQLHFVGMLGEVAVCSILGVPVRSDVTRFGDGQIDIRYKGCSVQVKTSTHASLNQKRLIFLNTLDEFSANFLIGCSLQGAATVEIHGFISKQKFALKHFRKDLGYGERVCVTVDELTALSEIDAAIDLYEQRKKG